MTASITDIEVRKTALRIYTLLRKAHGRTGFTDLYAKTLASYIAKGLHETEEAT